MDIAGFPVYKKELLVLGNPESSTGLSRYGATKKKCWKKYQK